MLFKKNTYYITYWDRYTNTRHCFIKARNEHRAEAKFYKTHYEDTIVKIALL